MKDSQAIWNAQAESDLVAMAHNRITLTPHNFLGAVLLRAFGKRIFTYDVADVPKMTWLGRALADTGPDVLDVGVRTGATAAFLKHHGKNVFGIDIARQYIDHCATAGHIKCGWICDIERDEIPGGPYDVVYFSEVIEHLLDARSALGRIARAIKHGGVLLLTTPNLAYVINRVRLLLGRDLDKLTIDRGEVGHQHIRVFTARLLKKLCRDAGLHVDMVSSDGVPVRLPWIASSGTYPPTIVLPGTSSLIPTFGRTLFIRARRD